MRRSELRVIDSIVVDKLKKLNLYLDLEYNKFNNTYRACIVDLNFFKLI